jgi:exodeoxyribonuclease VII small subunit
MPANSSAPEANKNSSDPSFEMSLAELEEIVSQLEAGEKPLDESLTLYERGVAALKRCHTILDKAEKRIKILVKSSTGEPQVKDADIPMAGAGKKASSRRVPAEAQRASATEDSGEDEASAAEIENSVKQSVDSEPKTRQNPGASSKPKPPPTHGNPDAGGSLFGRTE